MSGFKEAFGANLKLIRKTRNITQEKLSELIDMHPRQLSKIETGGHFPSSKTLEKLCIALDLTPAELFSFELNSSVLMTGTGSPQYFKAVQSDNIIFLHKNSGETSTKVQAFPLKDAEINMFKIARESKQTITVEYISDDKLLKTVLYNPNGTTAVLDGSSEKEYEKNINFMLDKFKKIAKDKQYTDFIKLALCAVEDGEALEKLEFVITGMRLAKKKK